MVLLLLSLGAKGTPQLIASTAIHLQGDPRWLKNPKVQKLGRAKSGWKGWIPNFLLRWFLVKRVGDKKKQGKVPGPEAITANQKKYVDYHVRAQVHPALQDKFAACPQYRSIQRTAGQYLLNEP
jgi:hypothetical protein